MCYSLSLDGKSTPPAEIPAWRMCNERLTSLADVAMMPQQVLTMFLCQNCQVGVESLVGLLAGHPLQSLCDSVFNLKTSCLVSYVSVSGVRVVAGKLLWSEGIE
jgi:hypothetical protein